MLLFSYIYTGDIVKRFKVFLFNGILLTITSLIMRTIGMSFNVYISNKIGSEAIGIYQLIMSISTFFITLSCSGINLATTKIVSEQLAYGLEEGIKKASKKCILYSLFMGSLACTILFVSSPFISNVWLHSKVSSISLKIIAFSLPFLAMSSSINGYFSALSNVKKTAISQVLEQLFTILFVTMLFNYFLPAGLEYSCISLVAGSTISQILSFLCIYIFYIFDKRKLNFRSYTDTNYTKQIIKICLPISITSYIRSGLSTLKQLLIPSRLEASGMSCSNALSAYGIINGMAMPLIMFPCSFITSFSSLLIPEFSYFNAKRATNKMNFAIYKILKFCFIFSFLIMGIFWCFSYELNQIIYPNNEIFEFIKILCPLIILIYIDNIVDSILKGLNKQVAVMIINILDLFISVFCIYFLLPISGIYGYIFVLFVSEILNGIVSLIVLLKYTKLKFDFISYILKPLFSIIIVNFIFKLLPNFEVSIINLILYITFFIIFYFIVLILMKGIVKEDMNLRNY